MTKSEMRQEIVMLRQEEHEMLKLELDVEASDGTHEQEHLTVVRLRRGVWGDRKGIHQKTSLTFCKRLCRGENILADDISMVGAVECMNRITNLDDSEDGLYEVAMCDIERDYETGSIEGWTYILLPYKNETEGGSNCL